MSEESLTDVQREARRRFAAIYGLTHVQKGILFHALFDPDTPVYVEQVRFPLRDDVSLPRLERAWRSVIARHDALRTAVHWEGLEEPLQVVHKEVPLRIEMRKVHSEEEGEEVLREDRLAGFTLTRPPLMRLWVLEVPGRLREFVWTHHHIIIDGWSTEICLSEVSRCYADGPEALGDAPPQPHRHVEWLASRDSGEAVRHWQQELGGLTEPTPLPFDLAPRRRGAAVTDVATVEFELPRGHSGSLRNALRGLGVNFNSAILAAWAVLLGRHAGTAEATFGVTLSGRSPSVDGIGEMVGLFIDTLPLRARWSESTSVAELLRQMHGGQGALVSLAGADLRLAQVEAGFGGSQPLFESVALIHSNYPSEETATPVLSTEAPGATAYEHTNYPLMLVAEPEGNFNLRLYFDTGRFERPSVELIGAQLVALLTQLPADLERPVEALSIDVATECMPVIGEPGVVGGVEDEQSGFLARFREFVDRHGGRPAVRHLDEVVSYRELARRACCLADALAEAGVRRGDLVGVCLGRSIDTVVGVLGCWLAGVAYLPLDPQYPDARLEFMAADAGIGLVICHPELLPRVPAHMRKLVLDNELFQRPAPDVDAFPTGAADDLAYVIYTSGSTGTPKGVMVDQRGVANLVAWSLRTFSGEDVASVLFSTSLNFDVSVFELIAALAAGGSLTVVENILELLEDSPLHSPTLISGVPSVLRQVVARGGLGLPRVVVAAGEALSADLARALSKAVDGVRIVNAYGPTEATVYASFHEVGADDKDPMPIGRPVGGSRLYVLRADGAPAGVGPAGELYIGGPAVAVGYLGRPELNAERFPPDPFAERQGAHMFRTGDLVRWRPDGDLEFLGRDDGQVKLRGFRIELGEVETVLRQHDEIADAAVTVVGTDQARRLVAYVVAPGEGMPGSSDLRRWLEERLPAFMVPAQFVEMGALPLLDNGKLDRSSLPAPGEDRPSLDNRLVPPSNEHERLLVEIWSRVLDVRPIGVEDDFFELGGDSILSLSIVSQLAEHGIRLTPRAIFENPTIAGLARVAESGWRSAAAVADEMPGTGPFPLAPIQRWLFEGGAERPEQFHQTMLFRLPDPPAPEILRTAFEHVIGGHQALRLRFRRSGNAWTQAVGIDGRLLEFRVVDESDPRPPEEIAEELRAAFDLGRGPLVGVALIRDGGIGTARMLVSINHLVVDAVSWHAIIDDLRIALEAVSAGRAPDLAVTTPYSEWVGQLGTRSATARLEDQVEYWLSQAPHPTDRLPTRPRGKNSVGAARDIEVVVSAETTAAMLRVLPRNGGPRVHEVLLGTLALTVARWTGRERTVIEMEGHGRDLLDGETLDLSHSVGWFTSLYPMALHIAPVDSPRVAVERACEALKAVPDKGIGYMLLRHPPGDEDPDMRFSGLGRPQVGFNYVGRLDSSDSWLPIERDMVGQGMADSELRSHVLDVNASIYGGRLRLFWTYSRNLHDAETIKGLADEQVGLIEDLIADAGV